MDILDDELEVLTGFDKEMRESALPIWFESLVGIDWTLLHLSPVYYGFGIEDGDGSPVIVVPGFLGSDFYLYELYLWLSRVGYKSYLSNIGWNADCLDTLAEKLIETIKRANRETGRKVHLLGHRPWGGSVAVCRHPASAAGRFRHHARLPVSGSPFTPQGSRTFGKNSWPDL